MTTPLTDAELDRLQFAIHPRDWKRLINAARDRNRLADELEGAKVLIESNRIGRDRLSSRVRELEAAIGASVEPIIRVFIQKAERDGEPGDVEFGGKILSRIESSMRPVNERLAKEIKPC